MRRRVSFRRPPRRRAAVAVALTAVACAMIGGPLQASADGGPSAGKRCSGLFVAPSSYDRPARVYNLSCPQARSYSRHLPTGWSGALRNDGNAEHALIYRSRDADRVMRAIQPGGATAKPSILGHRPLIIISVPPVS